MRALLCPASLKGVLSARRAAAALARGVRAAGGDAVELPIADGGEGTAEALYARARRRMARGRRLRPAREAGSCPLARPSGRARGRRGCGRDRAATARSRRARSARRVEPGARGARARCARESRRARSSSVSAAARPSTAERGCARFCARSRFRRRSSATCARRSRDAARLFGPQKGATAGDRAVLERRLAAMEELRRTPGFPAPGGRRARRRVRGARRQARRGSPGRSRSPRLRRRTLRCDLVVTGEGQVDRTTAEGKAPGVVRGAAPGPASLCRLRRSRRRGRRGRGDGQPVRRSRERGGRPRRAWAERLPNGASALSRGEPVGHRLEQLPGDLRAAPRRTA